MEYMNEQRFEELWQRAEGAEHGRRLAEEYPVWRQQQRRTMIVAATLAIMAGVALPLFSPTASDPAYLGVCCNHSGIADSQWANLAEELLLEA
jgi:hypothetical protein